MAWTTAVTRTTGYGVTASVWNAEHVGNMNHLKEIGYTAFTADVSITATSAATADPIVTAGPITYEAVPTWIHFYCPSYAPSAGNATTVLIRDGSTIVGTLTRGWGSSPAPNTPINASYRLTPTAASHTYNVAAYVAGGSGVMNAGSGGSAGDTTTDVPGYIYICRAIV